VFLLSYLVAPFRRCARIERAGASGTKKAEEEEGRRRGNHVRRSGGTESVALLSSILSSSPLKPVSSQAVRTGCPRPPASQRAQKGRQTPPTQSPSQPRAKRQRRRKTQQPHGEACRTPVITGLLKGTIRLDGGQLDKQQRERLHSDLALG
jgi:hypothetical protein